MATSRLSNPLALAVLVLLYERPMHPYEMSTTLRERRKEDSIKLNYGSLYSVVASLERYGLIEVAQTLRDGNRPERTVYRLTPPGEAKAIDWLSDLIGRPAKEYPKFEAALSLIGALAPDDALHLLELRLRNLHLRRAADDGVRTALPAGFPRLLMLESDYQRALLAAEIAFVSELIDEIKRESLTGIHHWRLLHELRAAGATDAEIASRMSQAYAGEPGWTEGAPTEQT